jgi:nocardicin N-oxygenase
MSNDAPRFSYPLLRSNPIELPEEYARLRQEEPVCPILLATGDPAWLVTRHDDVKTVLGDRRFSREAVFRPDSSRYQRILPHPDSILNMDPPRHTRVRKLVSQAFTPQRVESLRPRIQQITDELVGDMAATTPPVDLNTCFGRPLALRVICEMLGVPFADQGKFGDWTVRIMALTKYTAEEITQAGADMRAYFTQLLARKRDDPADDLLSALISLSDEQGMLTESEVVMLGVALLIAGHDTSVTVLAGAALTLIRNPEQLALLRADPALFPAAVEELIRLSGPGGGVSPRITASDVELGGMVVRKGSAVLPYIGSACRDESVFPDPDRFNIRRVVKSQIAFGHGPHFCLGAGLARAELQIGLWSLFDRFPTLALAVPTDHLKWKDFAGLGGWEKVPVTWDVRR